MDSKTIKVGDRVRVVCIEKADGYNGFKKGDTLTISSIGNTIDSKRRDLEFHENVRGYLWEYQVELVRVEDVPEDASEVPDTKPTNPKDAIGSTKLPLNLVPDTLVAYATLAFAEGASKYGSYNWRVAGVRSSIYRAALQRHLMKWWNGEEVDPATGVPHLASVIACAGIVLDATLAGKITDDRPPKVPMGELIDSLEPKIKALYEMHKDKNPHHHTAKDAA